MSINIDFYREGKLKMREYERMHSGKIYNCCDEELLEIQTKSLDMLYDFNATRPTEYEKRQSMLKEMLAEIGDGCYIEPPFHSN
jgi:galactoside O-acetyltransferase